MSMIEDTRRLLQDVVAPDFKALGARVDALATRIEALEKAMKEGFALSSLNTEKSISSSERSFKESFANSERIMALNERLAAARHEVLTAKVEQAVSGLQASHNALLNALNLDRRVERMERSAIAIDRPLPQGSEADPLSLPKSA